VRCWWQQRQGAPARRRVVDAHERRRLNLPTLLVEDNAAIRSALIPSMKELASVSVLAVAETAEEGIAAVREVPGWKLVVIDLFLRAGTGLDVLRHCQQRQPGQYAVVLSNYPTPDMRARCKSLGADAFFDKSTELDEFFMYCASLNAREGFGEP
jgi:DNA-binding NarL/FixJ family response regulator